MATTQRQKIQSKTPRPPAVNFAQMRSNLQSLQNLTKQLQDPSRSGSTAADLPHAVVTPPSSEKGGAAHQQQAGVFASPKHQQAGVFASPKHQRAGHQIRPAVQPPITALNHEEMPLDQVFRILRLREDERLPTAYQQPQISYPRLQQRKQSITHYPKQQPPRLQQRKKSTTHYPKVPEYSGVTTTSRQAQTKPPPQAPVAWESQSNAIKIGRWIKQLSLPSIGHHDTKTQYNLQRMQQLLGKSLQHTIFDPLDTSVPSTLQRKLDRYRQILCRFIEAVLTLQNIPPELVDPLREELEHLLKTNPIRQIHNHSSSSTSTYWDAHNVQHTIQQSPTIGYRIDTIDIPRLLDDVKTRLSVVMINRYLRNGQLSEAADILGYAPADVFHHLSSSLPVEILLDLWVKFPSKRKMLTEHQLDELIRFSEQRVSSQAGKEDARQYVKKICTQARNKVRMLGSLSLRHDTFDKKQSILQTIQQNFKNRISLDTQGKFNTKQGPISILQFKENIIERLLPPSAPAFQQLQKQPQLSATSLPRIQQRQRKGEQQKIDIDAIVSWLQRLETSLRIHNQRSPRGKSHPVQYDLSRVQQFLGKSLSGGTILHEKIPSGVNLDTNIDLRAKIQYIQNISRLIEGVLSSENATIPPILIPFIQEILEKRLDPNVYDEYTGTDRYSILSSFRYDLIENLLDKKLYVEKRWTEAADLMKKTRFQHDYKHAPVPVRIELRKNGSDYWKNKYGRYRRILTLIEDLEKQLSEADRQPVLQFVRDICIKARNCMRRGGTSLRRAQKFDQGPNIQTILEQNIGKRLDWRSPGENYMRPVERIKFNINDDPKTSSSAPQYTTLEEIAEEILDRLIAVWESKHGTASSV